MSVDWGAVDSSNGYSGDGHGVRGLGQWGEVFGVSKLISFQQSLHIL